MKNTSSIEKIKNKKSNDKGKLEKRGYFQVFHQVEELFYGPEISMPAQAKILLYLKHSELRWPENHPLGAPKTKEQISKATGLTIRQVEAGALVLKKNNYIECLKEKNNSPVRYRLNKKILRISRVTTPPTLSLIPGGRLPNLSKQTCLPTEIQYAAYSNSVGKAPLNFRNHSGKSSLNKGIKEREKLKKEPVVMQCAEIDSSEKSREIKISLKSATGMGTEEAEKHRLKVLRQLEEMKATLV
jgi:hypothetical protein